MEAGKEDRRAGEAEQEVEQLQVRLAEMQQQLDRTKEEAERLQQQKKELDTEVCFLIKEFNIYVVVKVLRLRGEVERGEEGDCSLLEVKQYKQTIIGRDREIETLQTALAARVRYRI